MPATLRLTREGTGMELRRGLFEILVDGKSLGSLKYRETFEAPLQPGITPAVYRPAGTQAGPVLRGGRRRNRQLPLSRSYGLAEIPCVLRQAGSGYLSQTRIAIFHRSCRSFVGTVRECRRVVRGLRRPVAAVSTRRRRTGS
jgi:hypothetical protein